MASRHGILSCVSAIAGLCYWMHRVLLLLTLTMTLLRLIGLVKIKFIHSSILTGLPRPAQLSGLAVDG